MMIMTLSLASNAAYPISLPICNPPSAFLSLPLLAIATGILGISKDRQWDDVGKASWLVMLEDKDMDFLEDKDVAQEGREIKVLQRSTGWPCRGKGGEKKR